METKNISLAPELGTPLDFASVFNLSVEVEFVTFIWQVVHTGCPVILFPLFIM